MEIQNKNILKKIFPYLFVFVFSFVIAGSEYVKQISAPTEAADESVNVSLANVAASLDEGAEWKWNAIIFVDSYFKEPIDAEYSVHWCSSTETGVGESEKTSCSPFSDPSEFRQTLKTEPLVIASRQTTSQITHPGVSCGRVQVEVKRGEESLAKKLFDTGVTCSEFGLTNNLNDSDGEIDSIRSMILGIIGMFGKTNKVGNDPDRSDQDPVDAGNTPPQPPQGPPNPGVPSPILGPPNPNPPKDAEPTGDANIDKAVAFYTYINTFCNGTLNFANYSYCLKAFPDQTVADLLTRDIKANLNVWPSKPPFQCVIAARSYFNAANGYMFPALGSGSPSTIAGKDLGKLKWYPNDGKNKIQANDLAIWTHNPLGHMAYVTEVKEDTFFVIHSGWVIAGYNQFTMFSTKGPVAGWFRLQ